MIQQKSFYKPNNQKVLLYIVTYQSQKNQDIFLESFILKKSPMRLHSLLLLLFSLNILINCLFRLIPDRSFTLDHVQWHSVKLNPIANRFLAFNQTYYEARQINGSHICNDTKEVGIKHVYWLKNNSILLALQNQTQIQQVDPDNCQVLETIELGIISEKIAITQTNDQIIVAATTQQNKIFQFMLKNKGEPINFIPKYSIKNIQALSYSGNSNHFCLAYTDLEQNTIIEIFNPIDGTSVKSSIHNFTVIQISPHGSEDKFEFLTESQDIFVIDFLYTDYFSFPEIIIYSSKDRINLRILSLTKDSQEYIKQKSAKKSKLIPYAQDISVAIKYKSKQLQVIKLSDKSSVQILKYFENQTSETIIDTDIKNNIMIAFDNMGHFVVVSIEESMQSPEIIWYVIGGGLAILLISVCIFMCYKKCNKKQEASPQNSSLSDQLLTNESQIIYESKKITKKKSKGEEQKGEEQKEQKQSQTRHLLKNFFKFLKRYIKKNLVEDNSGIIDLLEANNINKDSLDRYTDNLQEVISFDKAQQLLQPRGYHRRQQQRIRARLVGFQMLNQRMPELQVNNRMTYENNHMIEQETYFNSRQRQRQQQRIFAGVNLSFMYSNQNQNQQNQINQIQKKQCYNQYPLIGPITFLTHQQSCACVVRRLAYHYLTLQYKFDVQQSHIGYEMIDNITKFLSKIEQLLSNPMQVNDFKVNPTRKSQ